MWTDLDRAKIAHEQAKRRLRGLERERSCRYSGSRENDWHAARVLAERTLAEVRRLEATQPAGELESPATN